MRLVVAEKPSVARDLAKVLGAKSTHDGWISGDGLMITWCQGHLLELEDPAHYNPTWKAWRLDTLPMLPEIFALRPRKGVEEQWKVVKKLLKSREIDEVVNACDAGREGELIFRNVYAESGCRLPVWRLWVSSMTHEAIRAAWHALRPGSQYFGLAEAARCRSEADWLVGLNATRALTVRARGAGADTLYSVGRVQTPTLAMIVARDREMENFVPVPFWQVRAQFVADQGGWEGTWFRPTSGEKRLEHEAVPEAERIPEEALAVALAHAVQGQRGTLERAERQRKEEPPPLLYDLTELQRRANQRHGFTADQTLDLAQALYEHHKLITYPRTDARYLTPDQVPLLRGLVETLAAVPPYQDVAEQILAGEIAPGKGVINAAEVGDHHALLPTHKSPLQAKLSPDEKRIYDLIARRLLAVLSPPAVLENTLLVVAVAAEIPEALPSPARFRARGTVLLREGWRAIDPPDSGRKDKLLPLLPEGVSVLTDEATVHAGKTKPPAPYNDSSLLKKMETAGRDLDDSALKRAMRSAGLGTPATRAAIIKTLVDRAFIIRDRRDLRATEKGRALIDAVPIAGLKSAELTGQWEARLARLAEHAEGDQAGQFMSDIRQYTREVVAAIVGTELTVPQAATSGPILGECPICHTPVREGRGAYQCERGRACTFVVFRKIAGREISGAMVKALLKDGRTPRTYKGFRSKKGNDFEAGLALDEEGRVTLWFDREVELVGTRCPRCQAGRIIRGRTAWGCDQHQTCDFRIPFVENGVALREEQALSRVEEERRRHSPAKN